MHKQKKLIKIVIIFFSIMLFGIGAGWIAFSSIIRPPTIPQTPAAVNTLTVNGGNSSSSSDNVDNGVGMPLTEEDFEERKPMFFTFLIFGLTEGLNANTIMVASYDSIAGEANLISIPRDTLVDVQRNSRKIVSAYPVGRLGGQGHAGGVERMRYEVQTLIGFRPDFYISVDYEAFVRMVDAVGGVEVHVPFRMFYIDTYQDLHIDLQAGLQTLNGRDALLFSRYRTGTEGISPTISDYRRIEHQQQVLSAVVRQLLTPASILRIPEFINIFNSHFDSDLSPGELLWFATQARSIGGADAIGLYTLPISGTSGLPFWYELPDEEGILELVNRTVNPFVRDITAEDLRLAQ